MKGMFSGNSERSGHGSRAAWSLPRCLLAQELNADHPAGRFRKYAYMSIVPNRSALDVGSVPAASLKRFTPDGRYLIAFAANMEDIVIYEVGVSKQKVNAASGAEEQAPGHFEFPDFFPVSTTITIASGTEKLLEMCCCSESGRYGVFIVTREVTEERAENENRVLPAPLTFCCVDFHRGAIADRVVFPDGLISLNVADRNYSNILHMVGNRIAILSVPKQVVHVFDVREDSGKLQAVTQVGPYRNFDDELEIDNVRRREEQFVAKKEERSSEFGLSLAPRGGQNVAEAMSGVLPALNFFSNLTQKTLAQTFRVEHEAGTNDEFTLRRIERRSHYGMLKVQLLDESTLLILMGPASPIDLLRYRREGYLGCIFVVYTFSEQDVLAVFSSSSKDLAAIYKANPEVFERSSAGTVLAAADIARAKIFQTTDPARLLPVVPQRRNWSPYFDQSVFRYDTTKLMVLDGSYPLGRLEERLTLRFHAQGTSKLLFQLKIGPQNLNSRGYEAWIVFHPSLPLVLVVQKTGPFTTHAIDIHYRASVDPLPNPDASSGT